MLITVFASLALVVLLIIAGRTWAADASGPGTTTGAPAGDPMPASPTREQLAKRLAALAEAPAPKGLKMGAMCYRMAAPPAQVDYICPRCAGRSVYTRPTAPDAQAAKRYQVIESAIPQCRALIKDLGLIQATLDETEFCATCTPKIEMPELVLVMRLPDTTEPRRFHGITPEDLQVLKAFLAGRDRYEWGRGAEHPIKDRLPRIAAILGMDQP